MHDHPNVLGTFADQCMMPLDLKNTISEMRKKRKFLPKINTIRGIRLKNEKIKEKRSKSYGRIVAW